MPKISKWIKYPGLIILGALIGIHLSKNLWLSVPAWFILMQLAIHVPTPKPTSFWLPERKKKKDGSDRYRERSRKRSLARTYSGSVSLEGAGTLYVKAGRAGALTVNELSGTTNAPNVISINNPVYTNLNPTTTGVSINTGAVVSINNAWFTGIGTAVRVGRPGNGIGLAGGSTTVSGNISFGLNMPVTVKSPLPQRTQDEPFIGHKLAYLMLTPDDDLVFCATTNDQVSYGVDDNAICYNKLEHESPAEECSCGFYAYKSVSKLQWNSKQPRLEVELSGKVIAAEVGYRAQHQQVIKMHFLGFCTYCSSPATHLAPYSPTADGVTGPGPIANLLQLVPTCQTCVESSKTNAFTLTEIRNKLGGIEVKWS